MNAQSTIKYLDTHHRIAVETVVPLEVSWGDRVSRTQSGPIVYGSLGDLQIQCGEMGNWWETCPVTIQAKNNASLTDEQRSAVIETYSAVKAAWQRALDEPEIAKAVEDYRKIQDGINSQHAEHEIRWRKDEAEIARLFRRRSIVLGEQTVPGKVCVRSTRGNLLGYADCWDGRWLGTVERI